MKERRKNRAAESGAVQPALGGYQKGSGATSPRRFTCEDLEHLLQLIVDELHLGADDDLAGVLARADDACGAGSLDGLFIHGGVVLDLKAQAGGAVLDVLDVALAAHGSQDARGDLGVVVVGQDHLLLGVGVLVVVLTAGGLEVEGLDQGVEDHEEDDSGADAQRNDHPGLFSGRQRSGEDQVGRAGREGEASPEAGVVGDDGEDAVQGGVHHIQGEGHEHEGELERFGDAADEGADGGRDQQAGGGLLVLGGGDHGGGGGRHAEHHAGEEAGHVHAEAPGDVRAGLAGPEVGQVARPMVSNQKTLFRAWCIPMGISRRLKKA